MGEEVPTAVPICGTRPVDVKVKMNAVIDLAGEKPQRSGEIPQRIERKQ
jgi:hypothetical protein